MYECSNCFPLEIPQKLDFQGKFLSFLNTNFQQQENFLTTVSLPSPLKKRTITRTRNNYTKRRVQKIFLLASLADYLCPNV